MIGLKTKSKVKEDTRVILIRHASKLAIEEPGYALDARGEILAMKFAYYFRQTYGVPDVVIAAKASNNPDKPQSLRSQQTVGPLLTLLAQEDKIPIFVHDKLPQDYQDVAQRILNEYAGKVILVCWEHKRINKLAKALGISQKLPKWQKDDFSSIYDIQLGSDGTQIEILRNQYNTSFNGDFSDIIKALESQQLKSDHGPIVQNVEDRPILMLSQFHLTLRLQQDSQRRIPHAGAFDSRYKM